MTMDNVGFKYTLDGHWRAFLGVLVLPPFGLGLCAGLVDYLYYYIRKKNALAAAPLTSSGCRLQVV
jgi:hypothetical protein